MAWHGMQECASLRRLGVHICSLACFLPPGQVVTAERRSGGDRDDPNAEYEDGEGFLVSGNKRVYNGGWLALVPAHICPLIFPGTSAAARLGGWLALVQSAYAHSCSTCPIVSAQLVHSSINSRSAAAGLCNRTLSLCCRCRSCCPPPAMPCAAGYTPSGNAAWKGRVQSQKASTQKVMMKVQSQMATDMASMRQSVPKEVSGGRPKQPPTHSVYDRPPWRVQHADGVPPRQDDLR